jgi:hypothetical protein
MKGFSRKTIGTAQTDQSEGIVNDLNAAILVLYATLK